MPLAICQSSRPRSRSGSAARDDNSSIATSSALRASRDRTTTAVDVRLSVNATCPIAGEPTPAAATNAGATHPHRVPALLLAFRVNHNPTCADKPSGFSPKYRLRPPDAGPLPVRTIAHKCSRTSARRHPVLGISATFPQSPPRQIDHRSGHSPPFGSRTCGQHFPPPTPYSPPPPATWP